MSRPRRLPEDQQNLMRRDRWLKLVWIFVLGTIVVVIYFTPGNSQAMKTTLIEDLLSFVPPLAFLLCSWIEEWSASDRFPLGFIRINTLGYLISSVALAGVGAFLIIDSALVLIRAEQPTIGSVEFFGMTLWLGWLMIAALL